MLQPADLHAIQVTGLNHEYGGFKALSDVSLDVRKGEFLSFLGHSGSGKTTLLRAIAGLIRPTSGRLTIDGVDVTNYSPQRRNAGMVFQNYALFPHMRVYDNVAYPLKIRSVPTFEIAARVAKALAMVNLENVADRFPSQLSGGQQQRIAVARAIVYEPRVLLMDEPLGALDRSLRRHMQTEIRQLQQKLNITCIYVTHDQEEALTMSDRIAVMSKGEILQLDTPSNIYHRPNSRFVASFVGDMNFIEGTVSGAHLVTSGLQSLPLPMDCGLDQGSKATLAIRPEHVTITPIADAQPNGGLDAMVRHVTFAGNVTHVICEVPNSEQIALQRASIGGAPIQSGDRVKLTWESAAAVVFS